MGGIASKKKDSFIKDKAFEKITIGLLGDICTGKTSLVERFMKNSFPESTRYTYLDRMEKSIVVRGKIVLLTILDMGGRGDTAKDYNRRIINIFKPNGFLLVYDVARSKSFEVVDDWIRYLGEMYSGAEILLVGNKTDVLSLYRDVSIEFVEQYANRENLEFIECSAKTGENTNEVFERLVLKILKARRMRKLLFSEENLREKKRGNNLHDSFKIKQLNDAQLEEALVSSSSSEPDPQKETESNNSLDSSSNLVLGKEQSIQDSDLKLSSSVPRTDSEISFKKACETITPVFNNEYSQGEKKELNFSPESNSKKSNSLEEEEPVADKSFEEKPLSSPSKVRLELSYEELMFRGNSGR